MPNQNKPNLWSQYLFFPHESCNRACTSKHSIPTDKLKLKKKPTKKQTLIPAIMLPTYCSFIIKYRILLCIGLWLIDS